MTINNIFSDCLFKFIDPCKNCGSYRFICLQCTDYKYYRHIDDKVKMKENLKSLRNKRIITLLRIWNNKQR